MRLGGVKVAKHRGCCHRGFLFPPHNAHTSTCTRARFTRAWRLPLPRPVKFHWHYLFNELYNALVLLSRKSNSRVFEPSKRLLRRQKMLLPFSFLPEALS